MQAGKPVPDGFLREIVLPADQMRMTDGFR